MVQEVLEPGMVSNLIASYAASGQFFWALHYWLAQSQRRGGPAPTLQAHQALLCACHARGTWQPALHILQAMLASHVSRFFQPVDCLGCAQYRLCEWSAMNAAPTLALQGWKAT